MVILCFTTILIFINLILKSEASIYKDKYLLNQPKSKDFEIIDIYFRPYSCFTQGLLFDQSRRQLTESCGWQGDSKALFTKFDEQTSQVLLDTQVNMEKNHFGEGITILNQDKYLAMTWKDRVFYMMDRQTLKILSTEAIPNEIKEGWGATSNGTYVFITDGSEFIHFVDPSSLQVLKSLKVVSQKGTPIRNLNELEYFKDKTNGKDFIWTNIFLQDSIAKIDLETGMIIKRVNLKVLSDVQEAYIKETNPRLVGYDKFNSVLNGIAYDEIEDVFYITGKRWSFIFKVKLF
ncbi:UNKNOWN [Stylonychia lemnae]|uniref:Glutamine cyclotransferase n=1 Tax=Stylonychia lemnae TaxID=5949 RepID=A0A078B8L1_STYLE|nr:UNKNOWN [Stylonychia lemnae]|eukprot:CDW89637.1 UNKNOWN [Stylonychia lemnae]